MYEAEEEIIMCIHARRTLEHLPIHLRNQEKIIIYFDYYTLLVVLNLRLRYFTK